MKHGLSVFLVLLFLFTSEILAQGPPNPAEAAADLRARLVQVHARETELQTRLNRLNEDLKPENIEHSFAGIGSTRPEELRQQRRKELSVEIDGVHKQLDLLAISRARLQSAIQDADISAYQQSAQGFAVTQVSTIRMYPFNSRWLVIAAVFSLGLLTIGCWVAFIRRLTIQVNKE